MPYVKIFVLFVGITLAAYAGLDALNGRNKRDQVGLLKISAFFSAIVSLLASPLFFM